MNLIEELKNKNILKFGDFTLRSGVKSNYYCDVKEAIGDPKLLALIVKHLIKFVPKNATCIAGSGYGGITLSSLVAYKLGLPLVLVRDKIKNHGTKKSIDGYVPNKTDRICIIDDVFKTGGSIAETTSNLLATGAKILKPIVVLNRSKSKKVTCLLTDKDIANTDA